MPELVQQVRALRFALAFGLIGIAVSTACKSAPIHGDGPRELLPGCWQLPKESVHSACDCPPSRMRDEFCPEGADAGGPTFLPDGGTRAPGQADAGAKAE